MAAVPEDLIELFPEQSAREAGGAQITDYRDGSSEIDLLPGTEIPQSSLEQGGAGFEANLVETMSSGETMGIAARLLEFNRIDRESREGWSSLSRQALVIMGIERRDAATAPFLHASLLNHPVIAEACVQFQANAIEEFYPATGPVKGDVAGKTTPEIQARVDRATDFMNYYLTVEDRGYYHDTDQMLMILPMFGSVFRKCFTDPRDKMPKARMVLADDFIVPYFTQDLENAPRYCHEYRMSGSEIQRAIFNGEYVDVDVIDPGMVEETDDVHLKDRSDRRSKIIHQDDKLYTMLEYHIDLNLPNGVDEYDDGSIELPYIVVCCKETQQVFSIRRNWKEGDYNFKKRVWFTHYKFLPGLGFYGWGFIQLIGALSEAASGAIRALLDSALMNTIPGGFRAKDGVKNPGELKVEAGKWKDVDATAEELAKTFFQPDVGEPSPALFQLVNLLLQDARRFASITEVLVGQADNKAPVGTTLALIEQSMKLFTAVHKRIFAAAREEFRGLAELFYDFAPYDTYPYSTGGEDKYVLRDDFDSRVDFIPVADPNIISDVQRIALAQAQVELISSAPELYGQEQKVEAHKRFLRALKVPSPEAIEPKLQRATYMDPVGENARMLTGQAVRAFPGQRHDLHKQIHEYGLAKAQATMPPDQFEILYGVVMSHMREHDALEQIEQVSANMQATMGVPMPPMDIYESGEDMPPDLEMAISIAAAQNLPPVPPAPETPENDQAAKDAEAQAKIERDTQAFIAKQQMDKEAFLAKQEQDRIAFEADQKQKDEAAAADILRKNADAAAQRQRQAVDHTEKLHQTAQGESVKRTLMQESAKAKGKPAVKK